MFFLIDFLKKIVFFLISVFSRYGARSEIDRSYNDYTLTFLRKLHNVFHNGMPSNTVGVFPFFYTISSIYCNFFDDGLLTDVTWYPIAFLICISLVITVLIIFSCAYLPSLCLLWRNVYLHLLAILWIGYLLLNCMSCLYFADIKPLSVTLFANIFSQYIGCLFSLFMVSFAIQKVLSLIRS